MKGILIYYPWEAEKNKVFLQMFQEKGRLFDIEFSYCSIEEYENCPLPDFVLNRTRQPAVSRWYQERQIPVFHEEALVRIANDKYATLQYMEEHLPQDIKNQKWCPDSSLFSKEDVELVICGKKALSENMVIKSLSGHGGSEVFLSQEPWQKVLKGQDCILQERIPSRSQDLRIYILGGEIYQGILRSGKDDFRSNYSRGGQVEAYALDSGQKKWIQSFIDAFPPEWLGMLGMDFILTEEGSLIFNEVEEMVGCRMLYQCTGKDIVKDYISWLKKQLCS